MAVIRFGRRTAKVSGAVRIPAGTRWRCKDRQGEPILKSGRSSACQEEVLPAARAQHTADSRRSSATMLTRRPARSMTFCVGAQATFRGISRAKGNAARATTLACDDGTVRAWALSREEVMRSSRSGRSSVDGVNPGAFDGRASIRREPLKAESHAVGLCTIQHGRRAW